ncbi:radical SAM family heme chaperone HemW [Microbacter margulisiae]|uniref:Heme chaperone HemW n=1 Tax=Microbacter margulisiae TaxID=1350067 RepID=A0A7W5DT29_9PORP|nr:radical SAM family heme chaperone HemW [Microbacter margulisiae]MBB3188561.1 oxygen-independent coproporphyrinogen-3 oxidase [Microbacter margulisiae]
MSLAGIYIHIPFCKSKCSYCDFYSSGNTKLLNRIINALCIEISSRKSYLPSENIETIYFGGGTPSLMSLYHLQQLFTTIESTFDLSYLKEVTIEANPDDLSDEYLQMLANLPFNRLSIGIQSFNNSELTLLKRRHTAKEANNAVIRAKKYFSNISIDLMFGLPLQTIESWDQSIQQSLALNVQHISAYQLTLEKGTSLYKEWVNNVVHPASDELSTEMYFYLVDNLKKAGFEQYEISNFAIPAYESKHNSSYWKGIPYLGIGPSAHSFNGTSRQWNISNNLRYLAGIENNKPEIEIEQLTEKDHYNEKIITALRTKQGISLVDFEKCFGKFLTQRLLQNADKYISGNLLRLTDESLYMTTSGFWLSDGIMADLMLD